MSEFQRWIDADGLMERWKIGPLDLADYVLESKLVAYYSSDKCPYDIKLDLMSYEEYMNYFDKSIESLVGTEEAENLLLHIGYPERIPLENIINKFIFKFEEVVNLEKNMESIQVMQIQQERKLRPDQKHKEECRGVAKRIWGNNPEMTIVEMLKTKEIAEIKNSRMIQKTGGGKPYTDDTVRGWINNLCPNRKPGRRRAAKKP